MGITECQYGSVHNTLIYSSSRQTQRPKKKTTKKTQTKWMSYRAMRTFKCSALNPIGKMPLLLLWTAWHDQMTIARRIGHEYKIRLMVQIAIVINRCSVFYLLSSVFCGPFQTRQNAVTFFFVLVCLDFFRDDSRFVHVLLANIPDQQKII